MRKLIAALALALVVTAPALADSPLGVTQVNGSGYGVNYTVGRVGPLSLDPFIVEHSNGQLRDFSLREGAALNLNFHRVQVGVATTFNRGLHTSSPTLAVGYKL